MTLSIVSIYSGLRMYICIHTFSVAFVHQQLETRSFGHCREFFGVSLKDSSGNVENSQELFPSGGPLRGTFRKAPNLLRVLDLEKF